MLLFSVSFFARIFWVFLGIASDMHHTCVGVTYSPQRTCVGVDFHTVHVVA